MISSNTLTLENISKYQKPETVSTTMTLSQRHFSIYCNQRGLTMKNQTQKSGKERFWSELFGLIANAALGLAFAAMFMLAI